MKTRFILILFLWAQISVATPVVSYSGMTEDFPPFNYEENKKMTGYSTEVLERAFKKAGMTTSFTLWPWLRAYNQAKDIPGHYVFSTSRTPEREKLFKWVGPISKDSVYLMVLKDSPIKETTDLQSLKRYSVSGQAGDQPVVFMQQNGFEVFITADEAVRMKMFRDKKIDMDLMTAASQGTYEKNWGLKYRRVIFLYDTDYWAAFHPATPDDVIAKLNKAIADMKAAGTLEKLAAKYKMR